MPYTRREFLQGLTALLATAGVPSAGFGLFAPYLQQPADIVPGVSTWFATTCRECPAGCGMVVRNRDSRVVKCEGNPENPVNRGRLCARGQAAPHGLYDPDRIRSPLRRAAGGLVPSTWDEALRAIGGALSKARGRVALVTDLQAGALEILLKTWIEALGAERLLTYEPVAYEELRSAASSVAGRAVIPAFDLAGSDCLVSFAADFLDTWISPVRYARELAEARAPRGGGRAPFFYVGPRISLTAAAADERLLVPPGRERDVALAVLRCLAESRCLREPYRGDLRGFTAEALGVDPEPIRRIAEALRRAKRPVVLPGGDAGAARAALLLDRHLVTDTVRYDRPHALGRVSPGAELPSLEEEMEAGRIEVLVVLGANPVYSLPDGARFAEALGRVPTVVSLTSFPDETAALAGWVLPVDTPLESWGDYEPEAGVRGIVQPAMGRLYDTRAPGDVLMALAGHAGIDVRRTFKSKNFYGYLRASLGYPLPEGAGPGDSAPEWEALVSRGGTWGGSTEENAGRALPGDLRGPFAPPKPGKEGLRLWAFPSLTLFDGRGANRWWLQEAADPLTNRAWGTWAELNPATASRLGIRAGDAVTVSRGERRVVLPVHLWDGVAADTVAIPLGQGHGRYGRFAAGRGANAFPLMGAGELRLARGGSAEEPAILHGSAHMSGREIVLTTVLGGEQEREKVSLPLPEGYTARDFYPGHSHAGRRWAMAVDLDLCIGCRACTLACQAENNVPVVGADGIRRAREMQWLRVDRYLRPDGEAPVLFLPLLCQHCDAAPCEPVCPVFAAVHTEEGLNAQVYNRCIGTRYCSNNCPYKVRRFNWFAYSWPEPLNWQLNPEVTVRGRGVMEKCTFCVQRIREAEIVAKREGRSLRDGEIVPACAQTCPTGVFTFGDLMDPRSKVAKIAREDPRAYQLLADLNTKPAVFYLKKRLRGEAS